MGLAALISTQLAQTAWTGRRSPLVLVTAAGSLVVLVGVVQTPLVSRFFGCRPLDPFAWAAVLGWSVAGAAGAELVPRWATRLQESRVPAPSRQESGFPDATGPAAGTAAGPATGHPPGATAADGRGTDAGTPGAPGAVPAGAAEPT
jgi:cation-transporting ATPase I